MYLGDPGQGGDVAGGAIKIYVCVCMLCMLCMDVPRGSWTRWGCGRRSYKNICVYVMYVCYVCMYLGDPGQGGDVAGGAIKIYVCVCVLCMCVMYVCYVCWELWGCGSGGC